MILSFKTQFPWGAPTHFVEKILRGDKLHTLRDDHTNRWKSGTSIHMATGVRTKSYNQFNKECSDLQNCVSTQQVLIRYFEKGIETDACIDANRYLSIIIDGRQLTPNEIINFIRWDGCDMIGDFLLWFFPKGYGETDKKLIHWTKLRY